MNDDFECCTKEAALRRAQSGDREAIELFSGWICSALRALAKRFFCVSSSVQDLCQAGYIGLMLALEHYNAEQGAEFITPRHAVGARRNEKTLRQADDFINASGGRFKESCAVERTGSAANRALKSWHRRVIIAFRRRLRTGSGVYAHVA